MNWLAKQLDARDQIEFRVERLQVDWIEDGLPKLLYRSTMSIISALLLSLTGIGIFGISIPSFILFIAGIFYGLWHNVEVVRTIDLTARINSIQDSLSFSKQHVENILMYGILTSTVSVFIASIFRQSNISLVLISSFFIGGLLGFLEKTNEIYFKNQRNMVNHFTDSTASMLIDSLGIVLTFSIVIFSIGVFSILLVTNDPLGVFSLSIISNLTFTSIMLSLIFSFSYSGILSILQLIAIRIVLKSTGKIPLRLRKFLDECNDNYFLTGSSGQYEFIHTELHEYFSRIHPENEL